MDRRTGLAAASRDPHLTLRRVDRQQALIERLHAAHGARLHLDDLARDLRVAPRTIARDVERLRLSGVPLRTARGAGGGVSLPRTRTTITVTLDLPEAAALLSSLAALGPTTSPGADAAMRKLTAALTA
ncbi:HTH domain-containing protein [Spirilliplanes yamanashiensis]|uniref:Helix-turn-helix type 11 domain-containing protein n=1 Tax=Spirilliplanes yamanashiensis TaxID=42233 RepID=A0A8J3Y876_9ACTN|nr:HTH domain-containing protein [Spirilliplanes yamanashiensis]MDP9817054.1 putative DNA-binding transcriptional regulator YafY [Spirilliplanes yamanashiensis]GIJ03290.1 hypothetical protein Sya03_26420 [Spirilliplanes yamanashiensis]